MWKKSLLVSILLFVLCLSLIAPTTCSASPNIDGEWRAPWMNRILTMHQNGTDFSATSGGLTLTGSFINENTVVGRWHNPTIPYTNEFKFVFSNDGKYIVDGYWDRGRNNIYSRSNIKGYRCGLTPKY